MNDLDQYDRNWPSLIITGGTMGKRKVEIKEIPVKSVKLARNSRLDIRDEELSGLMASIKETGLLQPIGVTKSGRGFEIVYGNRRYLACSKLGFTKIPAVVHDNKDVKENDIQNLTENIQRRNISLMEAGRYMLLLKEQGLNSKEIGARLGVSHSYVAACLAAYNEVPTKFKKDLEVSVTKSGDRSRTPGKISIRAARSILAAKKVYGLDENQAEVLYKAAKSSDEFKTENVNKYARAIKDGSSNPIADVPNIKHLNCWVWVDEKEHDRLLKKHVINGPFKGMNSVLRAILSGELNERVRVASAGKQ